MIEGSQQKIASWKQCNSRQLRSPGGSVGVFSKERIVRKIEHRGGKIRGGGAILRRENSTTSSYYKSKKNSSRIKESARRCGLKAEENGQKTKVERGAKGGGERNEKEDLLPKKDLNNWTSVPRV